jgi:glutamate racemase
LAEGAFLNSHDPENRVTRPGNPRGSQPSKHPFDAVFCDTCIGGSTVLSALARSRTGLRAFFLADYAVNPLGTKDHAGISAALTRWINQCAGRADTLVVACNTASVRLQECPEVLEKAADRGIRVFSMVDLLDGVLAEKSEDVRDKAVCLMGTEFTVGRPLYRDRLRKGGASSVILLPATRTESRVAHLEFRSDEERADIREEVAGAVSAADSVVLACTCFPLVGDVLRETKRGIRLVDPAEGVGSIPGLEGGTGPNRLTVAVSGEAVSPDRVFTEAHYLFQGWELDRVEALR